MTSTIGPTKKYFTIQYLFGFPSAFACKGEQEKGGREGRRERRGGERERESVRENHCTGTLS